jgi:hypothetical protein
MYNVEVYNKLLYNEGPIVYTVALSDSQTIADLLSAECNWQPPVKYPDDGKMYTWDEKLLEWVEVKP